MKSFTLRTARSAQVGSIAPNKVQFNPSHSIGIGLTGIVATVAINGGMANSAMAQTRSGEVVTSTGIGVNVRSYPGIDAPVIGGVDDGTCLNLTSRREVADGFEWVRLRSGGWVAADYIARNCSGGTNISFRGGGEVATSSGIGLNVRSGPGLRFAVIDGVNDGTCLDVTNQRTFADGFEWVRLRSGGWVAADYLARSCNGRGTSSDVSFGPRGGLGEVATSSGVGLQVRSGPGLRFAVLGNVNDGTCLNLTNQRAFADGFEWARLRSGGWVASDYLLRGCSGGGTDVGFDPDPEFGRPPVNSYIAQTKYGFCTRQGGLVPYTPGRSLPSDPGFPYVVAAPNSTLQAVRRVVPGSFRTQGRRGEYVQAGAYDNVSKADCVVALLRERGIRDARVVTNP